MIHIIGVGLICYINLDFNKKLPDVILGVIWIIILFGFFEIFLFIPSVFLLACGMFVSFFMSISLPLLLFLTPFQLLGAESINVLEFGFLKTLLITMFMTPIGIMNLLAT